MNTGAAVTFGVAIGVCVGGLAVYTLLDRAAAPPPGPAPARSAVTSSSAPEASLAPAGAVDLGPVLARLDEFTREVQALRQRHDAAPVRASATPPGCAKDIDNRLENLPR